LFVVETMAIQYPSSDSVAVQPAEFLLGLEHKNTLVVLSAAKEHEQHLTELKDMFTERRGQLVEPNEAPVVLVLDFLAFLVDEQCSESAMTSLLASFENKYLISHGIHSLVADASRSTAEETRLLRMYYRVQDSCSKEPLHSKSALFSAADNNQAKIYAIFGGQGNGNAACFFELADLFNTYEPLLRDLLGTVAPVLSSLCRLPDTSSYFGARCIDLKNWLVKPDLVPAEDYIASAPVSFPIIGLLGLAHYCVTCKVLGLTPGELQSKFRGATGHSQGLVVAAAIAKSMSWESFYDNAQLTIKILFWTGYYCHQEAPRPALSASVVGGSQNHEEGSPSCLLSVRGLKRPQLEILLTKVNETLPTNGKIHLGLVNSHESHVVSGPAKSLVCLNGFLRELKASEDLDQVRVPYSQRKPSIHHRFLPVSAPFHSVYLCGAAESAKARLIGETFSFGESRIPVYHTASGLDLGLSLVDIVGGMIDAICQELMDWPTTLQSLKATHIIAFGGNELGDLITMNTDGHGVRVILSGILRTSARGFGTRGDVFNPQPSPVATKSPSWMEEFSPHLRMSTGGQLIIDTKLSRLLGVPPVITAGMTPTTVPWDFVAAVTNAGYHVELAAGGYYNAESMSAAISKIIENVVPGRSITCNMIYSSPHAVAWQIPLLRRLIRNGLPIEGLTVGAGIPSAAVASQYITSLGLRYISFKPGSYAGILEVLEIAKAHPEFPVILQWTGGRGGGHHSYEDFHAPILSSYSAIRKHSNVILIAGSGFGDAKGTYPYLSGTWSTQFGRPGMPFDGILLGSRMMVSKESHTSPQAKKLILGATGVLDHEWERSYKEPTGGIITVRSEMGQPIHKIATRGVLLWSEMDTTIFSLPRSQRLAAILEKKDYIIRRLNEDFAKPWFGQRMDGSPVDLSDMTYEEVFTRLISLMFVRHQTRWVDASYHTLIYDVTERALSRFAVDVEPHESNLRNDPTYFLQQLLQVWPGARSVIVHPEDCTWFLRRCRVKGQKPVNFIPVFDDDFEQWFKKDSLWQSQDVDAVANQDAQRVCILHGPVAAQYSQSRDESVKDILDSINTGLIQMIQQDHSMEGGVDMESGTSSWQNCSPVSEIDPSATSVTEQGDASVLTTISQSDGWRLSPSVTRPVPSWIHALFTQEYIVQESLRIPNPLRKMLDHVANIEFHVDDQNSKITVSERGNPGSHTEMRVTMMNTVDIKVELHYSGPGSSPVVLLPFHFQLRINGAISTVEEIMVNRAARINSFYSNLWLGKDVDCKKTVNSTFHGKKVTLTRQLLQDLIRATTHTSHDRDSLMARQGCFPINACVILAWDVLVEPILVSGIDGDLLRLVHESVDIQYVSDAALLQVDDVVSSMSRITQIHIEEAGKSVTVEAQMMRSGISVATVTSTFMFRGTFTNYSSTFKSTKEPEMVLDVMSTESAALLKAREWFRPTDSSLPLIGQTLHFHLRTTVKWANKDAYGYQSVRGNVYVLAPTRQLNKIGVVEFEASNCVGNPIMDYLIRRGRPLEVRIDLDQPGWSGTNSHLVNLPDGNELYGQVSSDLNPIHFSSIFSIWAGLDQPIVHGMYTTAITAAILEYIGCDGDRSRVRKLVTTYTSMGFAGEAIRIRLRHTAMVQGRMLFELEAVKDQTGDVILKGEAEVEQASTVYLFTGQGSQSKGMGMQLYEQSSVARQVWDRIDKYLFEAYGKSSIGIESTYNH
jgi:fatty acid synthase subunit beta